MKRNALIAAIAAGLFSAAALAHPGAGPNGYGPMMGAGMGSAFNAACGGMGGGFEALGLTPEQRSRIGTIVEDSYRQRSALMDEMQQLRAAALRSGNWDYTAIAGVRERMLAAARQRHDAIDAVLTAEQRDRLRGSWRGLAMGPGR